MRIDPDRLLPAGCVVAATAWMTALAIRFPPHDGDLLWQRWLGERIMRDHAIPRALGPETFTASGAPWTPHEWLFSLILSFTSDRGAPWFLPVLCALAAGVALVMVVLRARNRGLSGPLCAAAVLVCSLAMIQSFGPRAQVFGWAGLATLLWLLEIDGPAAWLAVPLTAVWANLHASAVIAPALAGLFAVTTRIRDRRWSSEAIRLSAIAAICDLATLATPLGLDLPQYALMLVTSPIRYSISEWGATSIASAAFVAGALPIIVVLAVFGVRASLRDRAVVGAFLLLLFMAVRNVPIFALATAPIAFAGLRRERDPARTLLTRATAWTTLAAIASVALLITLATWRLAPAAEALPYGPARMLLQATRTPPRVFCEDFAWCSLFLADRPAVRFFMDGRSDPYPVAVWREYREVLDARSDWAAILDARHVDAVLVRRDGALDSLLAERGVIWRALSADRQARLYVRASRLRQKFDDPSTHRQRSDLLQ